MRSTSLSIHSHKGSCGDACQHVIPFQSDFCPYGGHGAANGFQMADELDTDVAELIWMKMQATADFGNGRGVRNVFEKVKTNRARRISTWKRNGVSLSKEDYLSITKEDLM